MLGLVLGFTPSYASHDYLLGLVLFCISPLTLVVRGITRGIILIHIYGRPPNISSIIIDHNIMESERSTEHLVISVREDELDEAKAAPADPQ